MAERTYFPDHRGHPVVMLDFRGIASTEQALPIIEEARRLIAALPADGGGRSLTDVRGSRYNAEIISALKGLAAANRPYIGRAAVVTDSGLHRVGILAVATFSGRVMRGFATPEEALEWLVSDQTRRSAA
jgi:hypothetical protein